MNAATPVIEVHGLSKRFEIYERPVDMLLETMLRRPRHREYWALRQLDFSIMPGEVVGIVGCNGAGKSTLLKILAGTLEPTSGSALVRGQVCAILELGTGFNTERTGRDNIYIGGLCLGMGRDEILAKMPAIIDFSELGDFVDQPVKTYSTGMYARLAFSVAMAGDPEVLIVDEALSVGDVRFQRKCFNHFEQLRASGRTILFVTHAPETVNAICSRAIYLKDGLIAADGMPKHVTGLYLRDMLGEQRPRIAANEAPAPCPDSGDPAAAESPAASVVAAAAPLRYGNHQATIETFGIRDAHDALTTQLVPGAPYRVFVRVRCRDAAVTRFNVGISIRTVHGVEVFAVNPVSQSYTMPDVAAGQVVEVEVAITNHLAPGDYFMTFGVWYLDSPSHYDRVVDALHVKVVGECGLLAQSVVNLETVYTARVVDIVETLC